MNSPGHPQRSIRWWHGLLAFLAALAMYGLLFVIGGLLIVLGVLGDNPQAVILSPWATAIQIVLICCGFSLLALKIPKRFGLAPLKWLAFEPPKLDVVLVSSVGVVCLGFVSDEVVFLVHNTAPDFFSTEHLKLMNRVFIEASPLAFIVLTVMISIGPGVGEELFFRGLLLRAFRVDLPVWAAVLLSSILFGFIHMNPLQAIGTFLIGLYLGFVAIRTGSIWPCIIIHALNNFLCALFARFDLVTNESFWKVGHPMWLVIPGVVVAVITIIALTKMTGEHSK